MKTLKLFFGIFLITGFMVSGNLARAQTRQMDLILPVDGVEAWCLNRNVSGEWIYHFTYHVDKKTGKVDRIHWNVKHADLWDTETGERYILMDTGHDNLGVGWDFWNNIAGYTGLPYNVEDGWLPLPEEMPEEGAIVGMNFKFIGEKGETFRWVSLMQVHVNANGEVTVNFIKEEIDCN